MLGKKGDGALEYAVLMLAVVSVILMLKNILQPKLQTGFSKMGDKIVAEIDKN